MERHPETSSFAIQCPISFNLTQTFGKPHLGALNVAVTPILPVGKRTGWGCVSRKNAVELDPLPAGELVERAAVKKFLSDRARMEREQWIAWASAVAGRLAAGLGVDAGRLFASLEGEVQEHLLRLSERPLYGGDDGSRAA
jgi:hypothetical protein